MRTNRASRIRQLRAYALGILATIACACPGLAAVATESCEPFAQGIPARSTAALPASGLVQRLVEMNAAERDTVIGAELLAGNIPGFLRRAELLAGNIPGFLRRLAPIHLAGQLKDGRKVRVTFCALPDYLAVGSDEDFLLVPMRLQTALVVAGSFGFLLPTTKMVDAIYQQAEVRLSPQPLPAGPEMRSTDYYWRHNQMVAAQRSSLGLPLGLLTAGDKKDLVLSNRLWRTPQQIAIYGWHRDIEQPIQPLSTVHGARYVDYSHGVRLVGPVAYIEGEARSVFDVLRDERLASLLSDEGPLAHLGELLDILKTALVNTPLGVSDALSRAALHVKYAP